MKNLFTIFFVTLLFPAALSAQDSLAYWANHSNGEYARMHLSDAGKTVLGGIGNTFVGGDFGTNNVLYALRLNNNGFYKIDTATGMITLLGTNPPPPGQLWMGLAYDDTEGVMYAVSAQGTTVGKSSIYTINETNGSYTLIGSQWTAPAITCIAIDDKGRMFGLNVNDDIIYEIDKTDGSATELGHIGQSSSGFGHSMDFDRETGTMYLATFSPSGSTNTLRIVDLSDGSTTEVGDVETETGFLAIKPPSTLQADFSVNDNSPCEGTSVQFTDLSTDATSWSWVFEGGLPPTSNYQNPTVVYSTPGIYDVELTVQDSTGSTDKEVKENYIQVLENPSPQIFGDSLACRNEILGYTTTEIPGSLYHWQVTGGEIIAGDSTFQVTVRWGETGNGSLDLTLTTADSCTGTAETLPVSIDNCVGMEENTSGTVKIFPNPAREWIEVQSDQAFSRVTVYTLFGKQVIDQEVTSQTTLRLNLGTQPAGIYLLRIATEDGVRFRRLVISR